MYNINQKIAIIRHNSGEPHNCSTSIDEDTIIAGYGELSYDFEFPFSNEMIHTIYGTNSWNEYNKMKKIQ